MIGAPAMTPTTQTTSFLTRWLALLGTWFLIATFASAQIWVSRAMLGEPPPLGVLFRLEYPVWMFWVGATIGTILLARAAPLDRRHMAASLATHIVAAVIIASLFVGYKLLWYQAFNPYPWLDNPTSRWFWRGFREWFILGFVLYWAVLGVYHAFANYSAFREREKDLNAVTLDALRSQLHPHFLFNALNTVSAVLEQDPRQARRLLGHLGELLRATLRTPRPDEVRLGQELALLDAYVDIERTRYGERLRVEVQVDSTLSDALVPSFLLQPLVENAIRHGIAPLEAGGRVAVQVRDKVAELLIRVDNDGMAAAQYDPAQERIGLGNTRRRLQTLYSGRASLDIVPSSLGGFAVDVRIPIRRLAVPA